MGHVAGHAFHEPGRRRGSRALGQVAAENHVVLKDVGQLVEHELVEFGPGQIHRQHHPIAYRAGKSADAFGNEVQDDVCLLEIRVGFVEDERRRLFDLEVEGHRQLVVGAFGVGDDLLQKRFFRWVIEHVEMRRVVDLPLEVVVANLVLAELGRGRIHRDQNARSQEAGDRQTYARGPEGVHWEARRPRHTALLWFQLVNRRRVVSTRF